MADTLLFILGMIILGLFALPILTVIAHNHETRSERMSAQEEYEKKLREQEDLRTKRLIKEALDEREQTGDAKPT